MHINTNCIYSFCIPMKYLIKKKNLFGMHTIHSAGYCHIEPSPANTESLLEPANKEIDVFPEIKN